MPNCHSLLLSSRETRAGVHFETLIVTAAAATAVVNGDNEMVIVSLGLVGSADVVEVLTARIIMT